MKLLMSPLCDVLGSIAIGSRSTLQVAPAHVMPYVALPCSQMDQLRAAASADLVSISKEMDLAIKDLQEQLSEAKGLHQVGRVAARLQCSGVGSHTWMLVLGLRGLCMQPLEPWHYITMCSLTGAQSQQTREPMAQHWPTVAARPARLAVHGTSRAGDLHTLLGLPCGIPPCWPTHVAPPDATPAGGQG